LPEFGWTYLSRIALAKAQAQLADESKGVRDEIGFLLIHQHYADRFFPGTSVLHTRLRYATFVPWLFMELQNGRRAASPEQLLQSKEAELCRRLTELQGQSGIIGKRSHGKVLAQPPSMIYWNALAMWGILRRQKGRFPSRRRVARLMCEAQKGGRALEGEFLEDPEASPFDGIPAPAHDFLQGGPISFSLTPEEKEYLGARLRELRLHEGGLPLLARLAVELQSSQQSPPGFLLAGNCWDEPVRSVAGDDEAMHLVRAGRFAAMAAIGRGVYAALVEEMREEDGLEVTRLHRDALEEAKGKHGKRAQRIDVDLLASEAPTIPSETLEVLIRTKAWLDDGALSVSGLRETYRRAEYRRKHERARLCPTKNGKDRRADWVLEKRVDEAGQESVQTDPLHYRWSNVCQLLRDLAGVVHA
jgi:hypothetical protein